VNLKKQEWPDDDDDDDTLFRVSFNVIPLQNNESVMKGNCSCAVQYLVVGRLSVQEGGKRFRDASDGSCV